MNKIYVYRTVTKSIAYDDTNWYINDEIQQHNEGDSFLNFQTYAVTESFRQIANDITKYTSHFKNIAVLTAAGTSMENGEHGGKTRTELWQTYQEDIDGITTFFMAKDGVIKEKYQSIVKSKNIEVPAAVKTAIFLK